MRVSTPTSAPSSSTATASGAVARVERVEGLARVGVVAETVTTAGCITCRDLGEPVDLGAVGLGDDADRAAVLDDDGGAVRALGDQRQRLGDGLVRAQLDRGVEDQVRAT